MKSFISYIVVLLLLSTTIPLSVHADPLPNDVPTETINMNEESTITSDTSDAESSVAPDAPDVPTSAVPDEVTINPLEATSEPTPVLAAHEAITLTSDNIFTYAIHDLAALDLQYNTTYVATYCNLLNQGINDLLSDDWRDKRDKQYYRTLITKASEFRTYIKKTSVASPSVGFYSPPTSESKVVIAPTMYASQLESESETDPESDPETESESAPESTTQIAPELDALSSSIDHLLLDMEASSTSVDPKYDLYSSIESDSIEGPMSLALREFTVNKRGLVGWYYTKTHSEDYDHDANTNDEGVIISVNTDLVALKYQETGSNWDIGNMFYGLYNRIGIGTQNYLSILGLSNNEDANYHFGLKKVIYRGYIQAPATDNYSFKFYLDNNNYSTDGNYTCNLTIKNLDDSTISSYDMSNSETIWSASLTEDTLYPITIEVDTHLTDLSLPDNIQLKWSSSTIAEEIIANRHFVSYQGEDATVTSKKNVDFINLNPLSDIDHDGIPNQWEIDGYYYRNGSILRYDPTDNYTGIIYYTSPTDASTDGDPYSDLEEVIAGDHPLIATFPQIVAQLEGITFNVRTKNKATQSTKEITLSKNTQTSKIVKKDKEKKSTTNGFSVGYSARFEAGYAQKGAATGIKIDSSMSVNGKYSYDNQVGNEHGTVSINELESLNSNDLETLESMLSTSSTIEAADMRLTLRFKNMGNEPAYNIRPIVTVMIGDVPIKTIVSPFTISSLQAGSTSELLSIETTSINESRQKYLTVDRDILKKVQLNYPITLHTDDSDSEVIVSSIDGATTKGDWSEYSNQIEGITSTINHTDSNLGLKSYKIFAGKENESHKPQLSIFNALKNIYGDNLTIDNGIYKINNKTITNLSIQMNDIQQLNDFLSLQTELSGSTVINLYDFTIRPGMTIDVETSNTSETVPFIFGTHYKNGLIKAYVMDNCSAIESVKAKVNVNNQVQEITMTPSKTQPLLYEYAFDEEVFIDIEYNNRIVATDVNGLSRELTLFIADQFFLQEQLDREAFGLKYVDLASDIELNSIEHLEQLMAQYNADSYVLFYDHTYSESGNGITSIYSKQDIADNRVYLKGQIERRLMKMHLQGYFKSNASDGSYLKPLNKKYDIFFNKDEKRITKDYEIYTGITNATGYLAVVGTDTPNYEYYTTIQMNNRSFAFPDWDRAAPITIRNMAILEADPAEPDKILVRATSPSGNNNVAAGSNKKYQIHIIGYFTHEKGGLYKSTDEINIATIGADTNSRDLTIPINLPNPKGYLIKIEGINLPHSVANLTINGVTHARGDSRNSPSAYFSNYLLVPVNPYNPNTLKVVTESSHDSHIGSYNIKLVGYMF